MMEMLTRVGGGLVGLVAAVALHELTHLFAARLLPGLTVRKAGLYPQAFVEFDVAPGADRAAEWANLAPTFVGLGVGGVAVLVWGFPQATVAGLTALLWWAAYTSPSLEDILTLDVDAENVDERARSRARSIQALILALVGWSLIMIGGDSGLWYIGAGVASAGMVLWCKYVWRSADTEEFTHAGA